MYSKAISQIFNDRGKLERFYNILLLTIIFCPNKKKGPITRSQGKGDLFVPPQSGNRGTKSDKITFTFARNFLLKDELVGWRLESKETTSIALGDTENFPFEVNKIYN
jgi:hypothetical protein